MNNENIALRFVVLNNECLLDRDPDRNPDCNPDCGLDTRYPLSLSAHTPANTQLVLVWGLSLRSSVESTVSTGF